MLFPSERGTLRRWTEHHAPLSQTPAVVRGLPSMRFHDLRHACASLLLVQGVHPRVVMETLGHSQISLTMDTYSHVIPALQREAADQMEAVLAGLPVGCSRPPQFLYDVALRLTGSDDHVADGVHGDA